MIKIFMAVLLSSMVFITGCANTTNTVLDADQSQVQLRSIQTRSFDTQDKKKTMRAVIATLQDLGFVLDKADEMLGTVSGTKMKGYTIKMTVSVRSRGEKMMVRANAQYGQKPITDPIPYQDFFNSLSKAMFLQANSVD
ncbi:hypothetical protein I6N98_00130 [Spongiibacter nanhainus]|uniref:Lipoprotein n=1 Tax=Spongiibacter nanhainus TaxID=2794344 RepID=A0A7T4UQ58_9GAMM|nr:hypothetical protein [Spongiibacter nanhainus]QQD18321.1 hypothetical protein I6N98_00130 [Spongiibacter nanhainus]